MDGLAGYAHDSLLILRLSVEMARSGHTTFYRVAALQLRLLLCDTTRRHGQIVDIALMPALQPRLALHPLDAGGQFAIDQPLIPLNAWLEQRLPLQVDRPPSIRQLIRLVCDQDGGAHVDRKPQTDRALFELAPAWILRISEYLVDQLRIE